ncbi:putative poly(A) polymerase small subunit [Alphaentomopoxvirus acuprea]|uniref:Putative poly(A) polymerase small subunit n=1 Tax=Alphaentomopoxvirus acuprea TaxID=62099 RepID=W6JL30_9POXV|nr:putative poly(A) polymerase small subunit [Anomala cuprea entomopoxvirus]BAO49540.1 putative poly(A) polymerase small subunit [Anomala cuprea entomopoxvirus]
MEYTLIKYFNKPNIMFLTDIEMEVINSLKYDNPSSLYNNISLLLNDIQILEDCNIKKLSIDNNKLHILYITNEPGYHIPILLDLYKYLYNIKWHLCNPFGFCIDIESISGIIELNEEQLTITYLEKFKNLNSLIIIINEEIDDILKNNIIFNIKPKCLYLLTDLYKNKNNNYMSLKYLLPYTNNVFMVRELIDTNNPIILNSQAEQDLNKLNYYNDIINPTHNNDISLAGYILNKANIYREKSLKEVISYFTSRIQIYKDNDNNFRNKLTNSI